MGMEEELEETHIKQLKEISKIDRKKNGLYPQVLKEEKKAFQ